MSKGDEQTAATQFSHSVVDSFIQLEILRAFMFLRSESPDAAATLLVKLQRIVMEPVR